jgi:hypothetical protein
MFTERFLRDKKGVSLTHEERVRLEAAISEVRTLEARQIIARAASRFTSARC